jgi:acetoacetyl-CoA synthetase
MDNSTSKICWTPTTSFSEQSNLAHFQQWLAEHKNLQFADYQSLWKWSVTQPNDFWGIIWEYFDVQSDTNYDFVLDNTPMPRAQWFGGASINYAREIFRRKNDTAPAIKFASERFDIEEITWQALEEKTAALAAYLRSIGVTKGDRVVAYMPNVPEAVIAFLATASIGAIWSSCSQDFGTSSVTDRFQQIEPKVLIAADGYTYNGKPFDRLATVEEIAAQLPTLQEVIVLPFLNQSLQSIDFQNVKTTIWAKVLEQKAALTFEAVPFNHPLYILYSSGTTGNPKAITHCHGGILLEHLKYMAFHNNVKKGENFFWYSTTGWMMWNFAVSSLLAEATLVIYEGSPTFPDFDCLWDFTEKADIQHFGTSAAYLTACMKANFKPKANLSKLISIGSTGSPLPPEGFDYVYENIKTDVWLASMAGGTDVCTAWVGGNPQLPVYQGEIQCRCLGADLQAWDEMGNEIIGEVGEMVVKTPMPSMPVFFWNDADYSKYLSSYFEMYAGVWRHGDWVKITPQGSLIIFGRSDATLNRHGIRIGTAEIYRVVETITSIKDSLILNLELSGGRHYMPLFVVLPEGEILTDAIKNQVNQALKSAYSPRHVPDEIIQVNDLPYTISGKKMEAPVKKILLGIPIQKAVNQGSMRNSSSIDFFIAFAEKFKGEFEM